MTLNRHATIRWNASRDTGCMRIGDGDYSHETHQPYAAAATVFRVSDSTAEVAGYASRHQNGRRGIEPSDWYAMATALAAAGFSEAVYERFDEQGRFRRRVSVDLRRFM